MQCQIVCSAKTQVAFGLNDLHMGHQSVRNVYRIVIAVIVDNDQLSTVLHCGQRPRQNFRAAIGHQNWGDLLIRWARIHDWSNPRPMP